MAKGQPSHGWGVGAAFQLNHEGSKEPTGIPSGLLQLRSRISVLAGRHDMNIVHEQNILWTYIS